MSFQLRTALVGLLLVAALSSARAVTPEPATSRCPPAATVPTAEQVRAGNAAARDRGFLWRLDKDGRRSWLYGTVHVAQLAWIYPGPTIAKALAASDTLALELDLLDPEVLRRMSQGSASDAADLPPELAERLRRQTEAACLPPSVIAGLSPELQVATLESVVGRRDGLDAAYGIDLVLDVWAHGAGRPVVSLETPELQIATIAMPTRAETLEFVESSLTELESGQAQTSLKQIAQVWADGDLDRLTHYESWCDCVTTPTDRIALRRLLDDRNPGLADSIAAQHAKGQRVFAAVGSLHMIGPLGLPNLLAQRGFDVHVVTFPRR